MRLQTFGASVGLLGLMLLGSSVAQAPAQTSSKDQIPKFRAKSQLVMLPVTVTRGDQPVRGLKKENFIVEEDRKVRSIAIFEPIETSNKPIAPRSKDLKSFDNSTSDATPRALTLIVIDGINTPFGYQENMRKDLLKFLAKNMVPNQLVGMVLMQPSGIRIIRDFTGDTASLIAALESVSGQPNRFNLAGTTAQRTPESVLPTGASTEAGGLPRNERYPDSIAATRDAMLNYLSAEDKIQAQDLYTRTKLTLEFFQQIAQGIAGYPGRKSLLWASASFPSPFAPTAYTRNMAILDLYERTLKIMADASIVVYPIDVKGLQIVMPGADATLDPYSRAAGATGGEEYRDAGRRIDTFREFAESTGGRVYFDVNNNDKVFRDAAEDSQVYYMLGYYLDDTKPGWHKLKVKLKDADGKVRTRSGFYFSDVPADPATIRKTDLSIGARSPLDYTSLRLSGHWLDIVSAGTKKKVTYELHILPENNLVAGDGDSQLDLDIVAVARRPDTTIGDESSKMIRAKLPPSAVEQIVKEGINYKGALDLEPGVYDVRFLVRDNQSGRMGSVLSTLEVK